MKRFTFKNHWQKNSNKTIVYIGRLEHRKGLRYLLEAFQLLTQDHNKLNLVIAGDGPDREKLQLLVQDMHIQNVSFPGYVSEEEKINLLAKADLFCSPAIFGGKFWYRTSGSDGQRRSNCGW